MRINIKKELIPYQFQLKISGDIFFMNLKHFVYNDRIYIDIYDENKNLLLQNEKLIQDVPIGIYLFKDNNGSQNIDLPKAILVPMSDNNLKYNINFSNFCTEVFLELFEVDA